MSLHEGFNITKTFRNIFCAWCTKLACLELYDTVHQQLSLFGHAIFTHVLLVISLTHDVFNRGATAIKSFNQLCIIIS
jgi:hypothetical protein